VGGGNVNVWNLYHLPPLRTLSLGEAIAEESREPESRTTMVTNTDFSEHIRNQGGLVGGSGRENSRLINQVAHDRTKMKNIWGRL